MSDWLTFSGWLYELRPQFRWLSSSIDDPGSRRRSRWLCYSRKSKSLLTLEELLILHRSPHPPTSWR